MKPEIIFVNEENGMVTMPKEELERLVDKAYQAGKADASPITITSPRYPIYPTWNKTQITCELGAKS